MARAVRPLHLKGEVEEAHVAVEVVVHVMGAPLKLREIRANKLKVKEPKVKEIKANRLKAQQLRAKHTAAGVAAALKVKRLALRAKSRLSTSCDEPPQSS